LRAAGAPAHRAAAAGCRDCLPAGHGLDALTVCVIRKIPCRGLVRRRLV
jgi:hypothetical protein